MDIDKELGNLFNDPLLNISNKEEELFDLPNDMRRVTKQKKELPDYIAQRKPCEDFEQYRHLFTAIHADLKEGRRSLIRISKTTNLQQGHFYIVGGQIVLLETIYEEKRSSSGKMDGRTRCIYENGTESDIMLQTLRKSVVGNGFAITETREETEQGFFHETDIQAGDKVTGYIYVLKSLSGNPKIASVEHLYKIGFTTGTVEERIKNAANEPTYLMAPVKIMSTYKVVNMDSHKFETLLHQIISNVNFAVEVTDDKGIKHAATEWYVVPLGIIDSIIQMIVSGEIVHYTYNKEKQCLERHNEKPHSRIDLKGLKVLTLNIKKQYFDLILSGEKTEEYRQLKQTTLNKYTYIDEADGKRYLRRYDVLHLFAGYHKDRESAVVEVLDTTYDQGIVIYHLGRVLEKA